MSTTATPATPVQDIVKEQVTYIKVRTVKQNTPKEDADGKAILNADGSPVLGTAYGKWTTVPESDDVDKEIAAGTLEEEGRQTFIIPDVNTIQGCRNLVPNDVEFVNIFSAGLNQKMKNRARTAPLTKDFQFVAGAIDLTEKANEVSERQRLSPMEKLARDLKKLGLPEAMFNKLLADAQAMLEGQTA
jgi:hypothetical protein